MNRILKGIKPPLWIGFLALVSWIGLPAVAPAQIDLAPLFTPPTAMESALTQAEWLGRNPVGQDWEVVRTGVVGGWTVWVVRHTVDGFSHVGAIRFPRLYSPGGEFPVILYNHGDFYGLSIESLLEFGQDAMSPCLQDSFFVVAPTYRSEHFLGGSLGTHHSEGDPSPFDRDADDTIALLHAALANIPQMDGNRIGAYGGSRGGNVAYHVAIREPAIQATSVLFGPTDFFLPDLEAACEAVVNDGAPKEGRLLTMMMDEVVEPYLAGNLNLGQARQVHMRWSAVYWLTASNILQIHHGGQDDVVPIIHSDRVEERMIALGATPSSFEYFIYPDAGHSSSGMTGYIDEVTQLMCGMSSGITGVGVEDSVPPLELNMRNYPNPFIGRTDLVFTLAPEIGSAKTSGTMPVELSIYDIAGRLVRTLLQGEIAVGEHRQAWDGRDQQGRRAPEGVYLARLKTGEQAVTDKLILIR